ncbi:MAG: DNA methyltransferase [Deltaproteobacteria bacterium]|nr:DNA methyltransferase [Deltaproteobacteria bacterium]
MAPARRAPNQLADVDRPVHAWYRFVLSFPPHLVRDYLGRFGVGAGATVLDPFCGTGTTLVECKKLGFQSVGLEGNPMARFAAAVKVDWRPAPAGLRQRAAAVAAAVARAGERPARTLPEEARALLLRGSISPRPLGRTLALAARLARVGPRYRDHLRLALAAAQPTEIGNLRFGPEVGVGPARRDAPVVEVWRARVETMAADLEAVAGGPDTAVPAAVLAADARDADRHLGPESIDAVVTSPPYPNEKDYTRTTRLESVVLGFLRTRAELRALKQGLVRSNTRGVYAGDDDDRFVADHVEIGRLAAAIEARRVELHKTSGFERLYPRVTRLYFGGLFRHLAGLRRALRPGARLAYVVGDQGSFLRVLIPTGRLLAGLADGLGYEVLGLDLFRLRRATATRTALREEVVVLRWPGPAGRGRRYSLGSSSPQPSSAPAGAP